MSDIQLRGNPVLIAGNELIKKYALCDFEFAESPREADIILYLESGYHGLAELPRLLDRVRAAPTAMHFVFSESDWPFPVLPGAYPALSQALPWAQSWSYLPSPGFDRNEEGESSNGAAPELLFSFLGRVGTNSIRKKVVMLDTLRTPCLDVEDGPERFPSFHYSKTYADLIRRSKFVLCPSGFGASSIRTLESMSLGRAPVVISDHWQPPPGIPWRQFCVQIRESEISGIPEILDGLEGEADSMGRRAKQVYDENFAPNIFFDRLLMTLFSNYANCSFRADAILRRAWQTLGWRELGTICHQARSFALSSLSLR